MKVMVQVPDIEYVEPEVVLEPPINTDPETDPEDAPETPIDETIEEIRQSLSTELCLERNISVGALVDYILDRKSDEDISESDGLWELEDAIACGIADETGYLVDSYSYEITEVEGEKLEL